MRLIVRYTVGDGCSWSSEIVVPVIYDSPEAFMVDFEEHCLDRKSTFTLGGQEFQASDFFEIDGGTGYTSDKAIFCQPEILTVDEFFSAIE
jgi:hypothetical protein